MKTVRDEYGLLNLLPGLSDDLMDQLALDAADGVLHVQHAVVLQYKDGRRLVHDPDADSCMRYKVTADDRLCYLGPRMHVAVQCLLEADKYRPTVDRLLDKVPDNRLITGVGWLLARDFGTADEGSVSSVSARLSRRIWLDYGKGRIGVTLLVYGRYEDPVNRKCLVWDVHVEEQWSEMVKTAIERSGVAEGKGGTPREALQALLPMLVSLHRQVQKLG